MELTKWLDKNQLEYEMLCEFEAVVFAIDSKIFLEIEPSNVDGEIKIFDDDFKLILNQVDHSNVEVFTPDYFVFHFGDKWYYTPVSKDEIELNVLKYIGKNRNSEFTPYHHLGIHTGFELCNGNQLPENWISKAKFLNIDTLGVCELNTLAGVLKFQDQCEKEKIKSVIGETITVTNKTERYELKLFVVNETGWQNLLNINSQINVVNDKFVDEQFLATHSEGLICVISSDKKLTYNFVESIKSHFEQVYFQVDCVEYSSNEKDKSHLENIQDYIKNYSKQLEPILLCDSYYLEQEDYEIKSLLNKIGKIGFKYKSKDQHFKSAFEIKRQMKDLGLDDGFIDKCFNNALELTKSCNFKIKKGDLHLPKYEMTDEQKKQFKTNEDFFFYLIEKGFNERIVGKVKDEDIYYERFNTELEIIRKGGFIDYFLILWDILSWCKQNDILTGHGRGSAASALTSYLLYITHLDPVQYKLIFERFLNEGRLKSLPDIDTDFESERREEVKKYIQSKYTFDNVCCIGTFNNFKLKSCIKDISRELGVDYSYSNFISSLINKDFEDGSFIDLFKCSLQEPKLKDFINENTKLINALQLILFQPKVKSVHAAGVIVTPKYETKSKIYDLLPVRVEEGMLISEWDKLDVDATGFLKEDILGLIQLDKINKMVKLIKQNHNIEINPHEINVNDKKVYSYFKAGLTEDVFQFNTDVQKKYMIDLQPDSIEELTAANALNRPGPMESNAQIDYIKRKFGKQDCEYDFLLEEVTQDTLGLYAFQEQVMKAYKIITECTPAESDAFRKLTSKIWEGQQDDDKIIKAKKIFFDAYIKKGVTEQYCQNVWDKLIKFSGYGFNIAHSASYAVLGYVSLWFKVHYPLEFWTISLQESKEELVSAKLSEIDQAGLVKIIAPDINNSDIGFTCDVKTDKIYWSINSVKFAGEVAVNAILQERKTNGKYISLKDFHSRVNKSKVNKRVINSLITAGCFDEIEKIGDDVSGRLKIMQHYYQDILKEQLPAALQNEEVKKESFWQLQAKAICGYGYIDYTKVIQKLKKSLNTKCVFYDAKMINEATIAPSAEIMAVGNICDISAEKPSKNGKYVKLILENNTLQFQVVLWNETYMKYKEQLKTNTLIAVNCRLKLPDKYYSNNGLQSTDNSEIHFV